MGMRHGGTTQRKLGKVRKARAVVLALLVLVAFAIVLVEKKDVEETLDLSHGVPQPSPENAGTANSDLYAIVPPPPISIPKSGDSSSANPAKISPASAEESVQSPVAVISHPPAPEAMPRRVPAAESEASRFDREPSRNLAQERPREVSRDVVRVPREAVRASQAKAAPASAEMDSRMPQESEPGYHFVQRGETLGVISLEYYGTMNHWQQIFQANRNVLSTPERLREGQKLVLPAIQELQAKTRKRGYQTPRDNSRPRTRYEAKAAEGNQVVVVERAGGRYHLVQKGETVSGIAKHERVPFVVLLESNEDLLGQDPDFIREGMRLWIPQ